METDTVKKSWWKRNWKWVVPTGGCLGLIALVLIFAGSLFFGISSMMSDSEAQKAGMAAAKENTQLIELLGEPIEDNGMTSGSFNTSNGLKSADINIPIKGPKGEAVIRVVGSGVGDTWDFTTMQVYIDSEDTIIDLLDNQDPDLQY